MLTDRQRIDRTRHIGSSDVAAILGLDPYKTAMDVWLEKTGRVDSFAGNEATERGNILEPAILAYAAKELVLTLIPDQEFVSDCGCILAHTDGVTADQSQLVEAKSAVSDDEYGEPGTDAIPSRHFVQIHTQMLAIGDACRLGTLAVLLPGFRTFDFRLYPIPRNDDLCKTIQAEIKGFWEGHVLADVPPPNVLGSLDVLKRVRRNPTVTATIPDSLLEKYDAVSEALKKAEADKEESQREILQAMGEAEDAVSELGRAISYKEIHRKAYEVKASSYRVLRIKKGK